MLSIGVNTWQNGDVRSVALAAFDARQAEITTLLEQIPVTRDLHTLDSDEFHELLGDGSPGDTLYKLLRDTVEIPRVATHKLLARKRPRLVPIRDSVVENALGLSLSPAWWRPWWEALSSDREIADRLAAKASSAARRT